MLTLLRNVLIRVPMVLRMPIRMLLSAAAGGGAGGALISVITPLWLAMASVIAAGVAIGLLGAYLGYRWEQMPEATDAA